MRLGLPRPRCPYCECTYSAPYQHSIYGIACPVCLRPIGQKALRRQRRAEGDPYEQPEWMKDDLWELGERDKWHCHLCSGAINPYARGPRGPSRDHVRPRSQGGSDDLGNLRLAHSDCNWARQAIPLDEYSTPHLDGRRLAAEVRRIKAEARRNPPEMPF